MAAPDAGLPAVEPGPPAPDRAGGWQAVTATERGAAHRAAGIPNQDAVATIPLANGGMVAAVADGHGHSRHFRSARGARLAVSIACQAARDLAARPGGLPGPGQEEEELRRVLVPGIVARWRGAVLADVAAEPFTGPEDAVRRGGDATVPYGTTLLLHPASPGQVVLRNEGTQPWVMRPDGEEAKTVEPGRRLAARTMTIDFGPARGRIPGIQTAGTPRGHAPAGEGGR